MAIQGGGIARALTRHAVLMFLVGGNILGAVLARDYGESWDERVTTIVYGQQAWEAFLNGKAPSEWHENTEYYGPIYLAIVEGISGATAHIAGGIPRPFVRHFLYFEAFLISVVWFHRIARRFSAAAASRLATALYATRPLFFGHGFINPKDMPLLALFLGSIAAGLALVDRQEADERAQSMRATPTGLRAIARHAWQSSDRRLRWVAIGLTLLGLGLAADMLVLHRVVAPALQAQLAAAYRGVAGGPVGWIFHSLASHSTEIPLEAYAEKLATLERWLRLPLACLCLVPAVVAGRAAFRSTLSGITALPVVAQTVVAGALVGLTTSVRVAGPWAGVIVLVVWWVRRRRISVSLLVIYGASAVLVTYLSWPYLWEAPIANLSRSVAEMVNFQWNYPVLFGARVVAAPDLPRYALPFFLVVQTTEPVLVLAGVGVWVLARSPARREPWKIETILVGLWIGVPLIIALLFGTVIYDNARQYLFLRPPLFVMAGIGVEFLFRLLGPQTLARAFLVVLALAPGFVGIIQLHPYEYIYYNLLVGGVSGANRRFELDYWATSYREAMERVNRLAPANAWIAVSGPWQLASEWARPDLKLFQPRPDDPEADPIPAFAILTTRSNEDLKAYPWAPVVAEVSAGGGNLTVVRQTQDGLP